MHSFSHNKNLKQTANTVAFFATETQKTAPARRWLGWRYKPLGICEIF